MEFVTKVDIPRATFSIAPCERMLFVGSCFADNMGQKFAEDKFRAVVNPFGVMYNPASIMHTVERYEGELRAWRCSPSAPTTSTYPGNGRDSR